MTESIIYSLLWFTDRMITLRRFQLFLMLGSNLLNDVIFIGPNKSKKENSCFLSLQLICKTAWRPLSVSKQTNQNRSVIVKNKIMISSQWIFKLLKNGIVIWTEGFSLVSYYETDLTKSSCSPVFTLPIWRNC